MKKESCPAFGKRCRKCQKLNHFAVQCCGEGKKQQVNSVSDDETDGEGYEEVRIVTLTPEEEHIKSLSESPFERQLFATMKINKEASAVSA